MTMDTPFIRPSHIQIPALSSYNGELRVPGSKSITNRVLLVSALAEGTTRLHNLLKSDDTRYMGEALKALGVKAEMTDDFTEAVIEGNGAPIDEIRSAAPGFSFSTFLLFILNFRKKSETLKLVTI